MRTLSLVGWSLVVVSAVAFAACSSTGNGATQGVGGGGSPTGTGGSTGVMQGASSTSGDLFDASAGSGGAGTGGSGGAFLIYASTDTDLFTLDPQDPSLTLNHVGTFDCIPSQNSAMVDVAVNKNGDLWGVTGHDLYPLTVQGTTVHCGTKISLSTSTGGSSPTFYALTFAPEGVIDPAKEVLIAGNSAGELWAIDDAGKVTQHGAFGTVPADDGRGHTYANQGKLWELSGDIVFLANNGSPVGFATVRDCPNPPSTTGCNKIDTLIEIDMTMLAQPGTQNVTKGVRGQVLKAAGCSDTGTDPGYGSMYGIAAWEGQVYGFSRTGNLVPISNVDGSACLKQNYSPNQFSGAAVTTLAPVIPPPPIN